MFVQRFINFFIRCDFLILVSYVIFLNAPFFSFSYFPTHDTQFVFQSFYFFYNQLFFDHSIAQWMPFEPFGIPAHLTQLRQLSLMSYATMFGGLLLGVKDVLILFKVSVVAEQLVLLLGMYVLSGHLFKRRSVVFFVCLAAMHGATSWGEQIYFDLRFFYMFPLAIYAFLLFFEKKKSEYLWLLGLVLSLWVMGNTVYLAIIWFFIFLVMGVMLFVRERNILQAIGRQTPRGLIFLAITAAVLLAFVFILSDFKNSVDLLSRTTSGKNPLNTFLVHGGESSSLPQFVIQLFSVKYSNHYIGFLPCVFFIWAALRVREQRLYAFLFTILALVALSFQGLWSIVFYYLVPGLGYYRHLAFFYGLIKILILICAGFGCENFLAVAGRERTKFIILLAAVGIFLSDALRITSSRLYELALDNATKDHFFSLWLDETKVRIFLAPLILLIAGLLLLQAVETGFKKFKRIELEKKLVNAAALILIFGVLFFEAYNVHAYALKSFPKISDEYKQFSHTVSVSPVIFQPARSMDPLAGRQEDAYRLAVRKGGGAQYSTICDFAQFDMCHCPFHVDGYAKGFSGLTESRTSVNGDLLNTLGCGVPKLRLVSKGVYFDSEQKAKEGMRGTGDLFSAAILSDGDARLAQEILNEGYGSGSQQGKIDVTKFTNDQLTAKIDVQSAQGAWLVYADAFNSGWHAKVDGKPVPVFKAYLIFKAIWVKTGAHEIQFYYQNWLPLLSSYFLAFAGTIAGMIFMIFLGRQLWRNPFS